MKAEYREGPPRGLRGLARRIALVGGDRRSPRAHAAFARIVGAESAGAPCWSIGGGPARAHARLTNLNIAPFPNVDLVATAYALPCRAGVIGAIHCEAVLEHLEYPDRAVQEMYRVLRPGGLLFAATPFLQSFHAYPGHFQNFTLEGHRRLFERAGFLILDAGPCVGPTFAIVDLFVNYARAFLPGRLLRGIAAYATAFVGVFFRPLDSRLNRHPNAHRLASTTFVLAQKSG